MQHSAKLIALGLSCFLVFFVAQFPARAGFALLAPEGVEAFGLEGTLWQGSARIVNAGGQQLRNTEWDLALPRLLLGQIGGDFKTRWADGFAEGFGTVSLAGTLRLDDVQMSMAAGSLRSMVGTPDLGGQIKVSIDSLELANNWPQRLVARAELLNLSSPMMGRGKAGTIGNLSLQFDSTTDTDPERLTGIVRDEGGPLEINGELVLAMPTEYELKARIKARDNAPEALRSNLDFLGPPEADGTRIFQFAGSI